MAKNIIGSDRECQELLSRLIRIHKTARLHLLVIEFASCWERARKEWRQLHGFVFKLSFFDQGRDRQFSRQDIELSCVQGQVESSDMELYSIVGCRYYCY